LLYFNQYATAPQSSPLFQNACTGTEITENNSMPSSSAPQSAWLAWQEQLFSQFRDDVNSGKLPQVSWLVGPAGYTEHPDYPINYGAWYISQILDILVAKPEVFSKTVFIINYDEPDGSFDHVLPPTPPATPAYGASTVSIENEIVNDPATTPSGPIGLNCRVSFLAISPWSKGGYVNSQVFDHTSVIQFIEKRFGVYEKNLTPWRRAVMGDLTSAFNFAKPNESAFSLPSTTGFLPSVEELAGGPTTTFSPTLSTVILGVPEQEKGIRPARALPYELNAYGTVDTSNGTVGLKFHNPGKATVVFQVRSVNPADTVRTYTVEPGKMLADSWNVASSYGLSVYGPNGFVRYFNGSIGSNAAVLDVRSRYKIEGRDWDDRDWDDRDWDDRGSERRAILGYRIKNVAAHKVYVTVLDAYTGDHVQRTLQAHEAFEGEMSVGEFHNWYDLIISVSEDSTFKYRLAGHIETGRDSFSDPALGGLVTLKG
jgi:phospholipase C